MSRGPEVPRLPLAVILLIAGTLMAALAAAAEQARAQTRKDTDAQLLDPAFDGNPKSPPRFRTWPKRQPSGPLRFSEASRFSYRAAQGAGVTGYDSVHPRRRKPDRPAPAPTGSNAALAAIEAGTTTKAEGSTTPARRQPHAGLLASRRSGAGALAVRGAVVGTLAGPPRRLRPPPEEKPFAPLGIQAGAFKLSPAVEFTRGHDTNPGRETNGTASWFTTVAPELLLHSNWARHELAAQLRGSYIAYDSVSSLNRPNVDAKAKARIDITSRSRIDLEARYLLFTDNPGSPNIQADLARLPIAMTFGGSAGVGQRFNRFEVTLKGSAEHTVYNDSTFTDGSTNSNADRNFNRYGATLRTGYELTPGVQPFLEIAADSRVYDLPVDAGGVERASAGINGKAGTTFEASRKLTGEVALGYLSRSYRDRSLAPIHGYTFDAALVWLASALTTAKLTAATTVSESTLPGVSGAFTREVAVQVDHAFRRWLIATVKLTRALDDYVGSPREDYRYAASAALAYSASREMQLRGEYRHEWRRSNLPDNDYVADLWLLALRLQR